ncbi:hypothetical protein [Streptomyces sp. NPDC059533]|uniref:hypothetical protein n=1 Tax=unclassified Streptomyces TaxID=2593676 RepID=UPI0036D04029
MTARLRTGAVGLVLLAALAAGCSGAGDTKNGAPAADPAAGAVEGARTYMSAVVADDWVTACGLTVAVERGQCRSFHPTPEPSDPSGPAIGPVLIDRPAVQVPATSRYPAGWGVMTTHTVTWPGKPARTSFVALRMTRESGGWWVAQSEDVADSDLTAPVDAVLAALSRRVG